MRLCFTVASHEDGALLRNFLRARGVSASLLRSVKPLGGFACNGREIRANERVRTGAEISFALPPEGETSVVPQDMPCFIAYEDAHAMVLEKPAGLTVHPTLGYADGTLANAFCGEMQRRGAPRAFRPVNRIDRNTSGLVLCAMQEYATHLLAASAQKVYYAVVQGTLPDSGEIDAPIGLREDSFVQHCVREDGKRSVTRYRTLWCGDGLSLAAVTPVTGRTHQIRVHFAHLGHPLAGDDFYGGSTQRIHRHALHCGRISFDDLGCQYGVRIVDGAGHVLSETAPTAHASAPRLEGADPNEANRTFSVSGGTIFGPRVTVCSALPPDMAALVPSNFVNLDSFECQI